MAFPLLAGAIVGGLIQAAGSIVGRVLISLGVGFVTYSGITTMLDSVKSDVMSRLSGMPADIVPVLGALKVDVAVSILFSAIAARLVLKGITGGAFKRLVWK